MPNLSNTAVRLYRKLFGSAIHHVEGGEQSLLDGNSAVAITEAMVADAAALGGSFPAEGAELAWRSESQRRTRNHFGHTLHTHKAEGPRGALAAAIGLAMAGRRATTFLSGPDIASVQDLLKQAAGRNLPLVIHLDSRALNSHGSAIGGSDEAVALAVDSGCFILLATNVQQAVDFTLIARYLAEQSLTPVVVTIDCEQTALAVQDVELPSPELLDRLLGSSDDQIDSTKGAQQLLFGEQRRRLPRWHDLDRPALHGALQGRESFALSSAAASAYLSNDSNELLSLAFARFNQLTGRHHAPVSHHRCDKAKLLLVAQGAAVETATAISDRLRKQKVGVVAIHALRPLSGKDIVEQLRGKQAVAVLERCTTPLDADPPLMRELRSVLERAIESGTLSERELPKLHSVRFGLGGLPLRGADLIALCQALPASLPRSSYLGINFGQGSSPHPKRQVLLDRIKRDFPQLSGLGITSNEASPDLRPAGAVSVAIQRITGQGGDSLAVEAASLLQQSLGGQLRGHPAIGWEPFAALATDRFTYAAEKLLDPGSEMPLELALIVGGDGLPDGLQRGSSVIVVGEGDNETRWGALTAEQRSVVSAEGLKLFAIAPYLSEDEVACDELLQETLLGALFAALLARESLGLKASRILTLREGHYTELTDENEREQRLTAFRHGLEALHEVDCKPLPAGQVSATASSERVPMAVRHLGGNREQYDSLPRFWDQVGVLYRDGDHAALTADPYMATGSMPPLSATFRDLSGSSALLPSFDPTTCSGCGDCWSRCPDSAIGSVAVTPSALLNNAIRLSGAEPLRQIASKLAGRVIALCKKGESEATTAAALFDLAFAWLQEKAPFAEDRKAALEAAYNKARIELGELPLAVTDPLFHTAEREQKEGGELLAVAINADACKGCGICIDACEPNALIAAAQDGELLEQTRRIWSLWEQTPDTPSSTIERVARGGEIDAMAALMLSRYCSMAVTGGDSSEAGSGEKIALRQLLAATEYQQQPLQHRFIQEIKQTREELTTQIRVLLTDALPTEDLNALAATLSEVKTREVDISTIAGSRQTLEGSGVDATRLRRLIELSQGLGELYWRLSEGEYGLGRSRYGLVITPGPASAWAGVFPHNPFQVPVLVDSSGDAAQMAAGVVEGQLADTTTALTLLQRAREEIAASASKARSSSDELSWHDLDEDQRRLCPPLLLIGSEAELAGRGFSQVAWLLNSGLPVKIVVLNELGLGLDGQGIPTAALREPSSNLAMMALAQRNAYVAQTSIAHPDHFRDSVRGALRSTGPALIHIHTPSPERHGFMVGASVEQARLAVESRTFPLFRYDPAAEGVFGSRLSLEGNGDLGSEWQLDSDGEAMTAIDWAISERRFAPRFPLFGSEDPAPTPLLSYLALDTKGRSKKTPVVESVTCDDKVVRYRVSPEMVALVEERQQAWRTLQELAGITTPFTEQVEERVQQAVAAGHQAEIDALKAEYEVRIAELQANMQGDTAAAIRDRLVALAGYNSAPAAGE